MIHRNIFSVALAVTVFAFGCASQKKETSTPAAASQTTKTEKKSSKTTSSTKPAPQAAEGHTAGGIQLLEAVACKSVQDRAPVEPGDKFPVSVGRVYVYTKLKSDAADTTIKHVWNFDGKELATVTLPVKATQWRTYSSKQVLGAQRGDWRVDVTTNTGQVLQSVAFKIE